MISKSRKFKKTSFQALFLSTVLGLLVLLIIGFLIVSIFRLNQKKSELSSRIEELKEEIQIFERKNQELRAGISQVGTKDFLEEIAKEEFNLQNPGEEVVVIKKEKEKEEETKEEKGILDKILEILRMRD